MNNYYFQIEAKEHNTDTDLQVCSIKRGSTMSRFLTRYLTL